MKGFGKLVLGFALLFVMPVLVLAETNGDDGSSGSGERGLLLPGTAPGMMANMMTGVSARAFSPIVCSGKTFLNPKIASSAGVDTRNCKPLPTARVPSVSSNSGARKPVVCNLLYQPIVCADGKTFSNKCMARAAGEAECKPVAVVGPGVSDDSVSIDASTESDIKANWQAQMRVMMKIKDDYHDAVEASISNASNSERYHRCNQFIDKTQFYDCMKAQAGIGEIARDKIKCSDDSTNSTEKERCEMDVKERVSHYWRFSFDALIAKTSNLSKYGVPQSEIDAFLTFVKQEALAFENETTVEGKKKIIQDVNEAWKEFRKKVLYYASQSKIDAVAKKITAILPELKTLRDKLSTAGFQTQRMDALISKLEDNLKIMTSTDATVSVEQKWKAAQNSVELIRLYKRLAFLVLNNQPTAEVTTPVASASVPVEVQAAAEVEDAIQADSGSSAAASVAVAVTAA